MNSVILTLLTMFLGLTSVTAIILGFSLQFFSNSKNSDFLFVKQSAFVYITEILSVEYFTS